MVPFTATLGGGLGPAGRRLVPNVGLFSDILFPTASLTTICVKNMYPSPEVREGLTRTNRPVALIGIV